MYFSLSSTEFKRVIKKSKRIYIRDLSFKYIYSAKPGLGLIVSKKYGNATKRNLFKRRCRYIFKAKVADKNNNIYLVISPIKQCLSWKSINTSFESFIYENFS